MPHDPEFFNYNAMYKLATKLTPPKPAPVAPKPELHEISEAQRMIETKCWNIGSLFTVYEALGADLGYSAAELPFRALLDTALAKEGWSFAGSGHFSLVYTKGELAIKVGTKAEDSAAVYAAWCRENKGQPAVPDVHFIRRVNKRCYFVLMTRYEKLRHSYDTIYQEETDEGRTFKRIRAFFEDIANIDIHSGNVMQEPVTGRIIITDPVSFAGG